MVRMPSGMSFRGQQRLNRADSRQPAAVGCKKKLPPVPSGVRKGAEYNSPTLRLIELEIGFGLRNGLVQRKRVDSPLPGGWPLAGEILGGSALSPIYSRMWRTESPSVTKATIRMSAWQIGRSSGVDSYRRASNIAHR